jgi:tetratricopeptide (TPR) repeat protein
LAAQYRDNDDPEACDMVRECLELSRQIHGDDHEETLSRLSELAMICLRLEKLDEAERLYQEAVDLTPDSPDASKLEKSKHMRGLGAAYQQNGKLAEAEEILREALAVQESLAAEAADALELAFTRVRLGATLTQSGKAAEAEPLLRDALRAFEQSGKPEDWRFADARSVLGECLASLGKYDEAEHFLLAAYTSLHEEVVGPPRFAHWGAETTLDRIVTMYEQSGKDELSEEWRLKSVGGPESREVDEQ